MIINVLGLGESLNQYKADSNITVGVNDIWKFVKTEYIMLLDSPSRFSPERRKIIETSRPREFLSHQEGWNYLPAYRRIELSAIRGSLRDFDSDKYCYASITPAVAVHHAYKLGAKHIVMYGVDLVSHPHINNEFQLDGLSKFFKSLRIELNKRGVELYLAKSFGFLAKILPSIRS